VNRRSTLLPALFECRESVGRDWSRTLVSYQREFPRAQSTLGDSGKERPVQFWCVKTQEDGSLASARVSFFAELRHDPASNIYDQGGVRRQADAGQGAGDQGATKARDAPSGGRGGPMAALCGAGLVPLPRRARKPPLSRPVPYAGGSALASRLATAQPEIGSLDMGPDDPFDRPVAPPAPDSAFVPESAADRHMARGKSRMR